MFKDLVRMNRSYRRFDEQKKVAREALITLVDYARLSPSGANLQALRYFLSTDEETNSKIFPTLGWAAYLKEWAGPAAGERPAAYIIILQDGRTKRPNSIDHGIAAQTILLGAVEMGLSGCMLGNVQRPVLKEALKLPEECEILLVIALGWPKETVVIDEIAVEGDVKYWRDENQVHHVPKYKLADLIVN